MNKRLAKEILELQKKQNSLPLLDNDYLIYIDDYDMNKIYTIIKAPYDSLYRHKFIRLDLDIPENYPFSPPKVTFVNHDNVRIHPTMYENGQCCSTILNTWGNSKYEKWTPSMGIETILLMFHSFLDNHPYMHEPGGKDNPSYSNYVLYKSWYSCLIRYLQYETIDIFLDYIYEYLFNNIGEIFDYLHELHNTYPDSFYYTPCYEIDTYYINYTRVIHDLEYYYNSYLEENTKNLSDSYSDSLLSYNYDTEMENLTHNINCHICFDTNNINENMDILLHLSCNHSFHLKCIQQNLINNEDVCPMCRKELCFADKLIIESNNNWTINPFTKRKIKVNGKTYNYLLEKGVFN